MCWFKRKKLNQNAAITPEERISRMSIQQIKESVEYRYLWGLDETRFIIAKIKREDPDRLETLVEVYYNAFVASRYTKLNNNKTVDSSILKILFFEVSMAIQPLLQETKQLDDTEMRSRAKIFSNIFKLLDTPWRETRNSEGREFLRKQIESKWRETMELIFQNFTKEEPTYEDCIELFALCQENDPIILRITKLANTLSPAPPLN